MKVHLLWSTVVLLSSPLLTLCDPLYVLSAPNLLRVGSSENVFVEAQDYNGGDLRVRIMVKNFPTKTTQLLDKTVMLTRKNNFQILTDIKIPHDELYLNSEGEKQFVYLQAEFNSNLLEKVVMLSFQSGYIFIQTDKPLYTPDSTVNYRIFSLTPNLRLGTSGISVGIMNPQGITVHTESVKSEKGMASKAYKIPEMAIHGIWKVVTWSTNTPNKTFTADFEVKEYVLPSFEVTLTVSKLFFYVGDDKLKINILAKYLFGRNVEGQAYVVFGIMDEERKLSIPDSLQMVPIREGVGSGTLTKDMILKTTKEIENLVGKSIYVSVSVLTETGSEMVEAQKRGIQIVKSPYTIHFKRTPQFFKPGMPFDVSVYVTNPDETPAENVPVEVNPGGVIGQTKANGIAKITVNSQANSLSLQITVKTIHKDLKAEQQANKMMTAQAYTPKVNSRNFLHIGIDAAELEIGDQRNVNLNMAKSSTIKNHDITYMIINKGQILSVGREKTSEQSLISVHLPVTKDMVPSFRIVGYYHVGSDEVVSDSVWVDVKDTCMGTLKLKLKEEGEKQVNMEITGDPGAKVGLVVVDKAVHVLNKNRLTQSKIWDVIEKHDTGCTAGSGRDSMGVFYDAGLMFKSSTAVETNTRTMPECPVPSKRRRRAETLLQITTTLSGKYSGDLKKCCADGMRENKLGYTCERRATYIEDEQECVQAFLHCCNEVKNSKEKFGEAELVLARNDVADEYPTDSDDVVLRSIFPESWFWNEVGVPQCGDKTCVAPKQVMYLKDSITTWQILAISVSDTHGICVADPLEIINFVEFFIDLKVPYSAVRSEQIEIKAVIHNHTKRKLKKVRVNLIETPDVCSAASKKGKYQTLVEVDSHSTRAVSFVIIPMKLGDVSIEVMAESFDFADRVRKSIKVVSEGVIREIVKNVELNPAKMGGLQHVPLRSDKPSDWIPDTPANVFVSVSGEEITQTVEQAISGHFMGQLIVQPGGCGEQNVMYMTLPLIATVYLDSTNQWEAVGVDRRSEAVNHIKTGYQNQLNYRKPDGSFGAWSHSESGTWLTAYVAKVFAMANSFNIVTEDVLCSALKWLVLHKQLPDGSFKDDRPIFTINMGGDVRGKDGDASLTAFVLIAMQEGSEICAGLIGSLHDSKRKAVGYLEGRLQSLTNPYAVAMTSYAMANENKLNKDVLMKHSTKREAWIVPGQHYHSLEATAYAILALVKAKEYDTAREAVRWLARQQSHYGSYQTTQATIMVFQALAKYHTQVRETLQKDFRLDVQLSVAKRSGRVRWTFTKDNLHATRSDKLSLGQDFNVTAQGTGTATLSVRMLYYAKPAETINNCKNFDLTVKLKQEKEPSYVGALESYTLTLEFFYQMDTDATMTILDVGLLTGFIVDEGDLRELTKGKDRFIQDFEMNKVLSERGSLIIYLDKASHREIERIVFRMHKMIDAHLQPAGVTIYEYYSPDSRCTKYYHPERQDGTLLRLCQGDVCLCAEEKCSLQKNEEIPEDDRWVKACESTMEYVYKVKVEAMNLTVYSDIYIMKVLSVLKPGTDEDVEGNERIFMNHPSCRKSLDIKIDKTYLVMGKFIDMPQINDRWQYILGEHTWIEYWPTREESQIPEYSKKYIGLSTLTYKLSTGCVT
ncbi:complement C3-like isoform X2 [Triplophysa dalaica]|uniref:complement C3-like isoform X2 n=1 Tax=Triplophysa dalaica TaxID=1582913 RepID=UPI0024E00CD5|nr:complement C3-like isoform X2 [Triplophysa dalaica]